MAHALMQEVKELKDSLAQFFKNANQEELSQRKSQIETTLNNISREAGNLDNAMEARDATIRALGEKLSVLRMKHAEPFYVNPLRKRSPSMGRKSLFRVQEIREWSNTDARDHMKEMADQIARLSLQPIAGGLSPEEIEEHVADIAATRLFESKALNLIKVARKRGLSDERIAQFLAKKSLPKVTIDRCFAQVESELSEQSKAIPVPPPVLIREESGEEDSDSEDNSLCQYEFPTLIITSDKNIDYESPPTKIGC